MWLMFTTLHQVLDKNLNVLLMRLEASKRLFFAILNFSYFWQNVLVLVQGTFRYRITTLQTL